MPLYRSLGWELAGGKYEAAIPARSLWSLRAPDAAAAAGRDAGTEVRRAGPDDAAEVTAVIGRAHEAARDSGPLTWDLPPSSRWLARDDMYAYLTDDGFAAYRWDGGNADLFVERVHGASAGTGARAVVGHRLPRVESRRPCGCGWHPTTRSGG